MRIILTVVPKLFGWFCRRQFFHRPGSGDGFRMIQVHLYLLCTLFVLLSHQLHLRSSGISFWGWGPLQKRLCRIHANFSSYFFFTILQWNHLSLEIIIYKPKRIPTKKSLSRKDISVFLSVFTSHIMQLSCLILLQHTVLKKEKPENPLL